jgi:hypothetical protein
VYLFTEWIQVVQLHDGFPGQLDIQSWSIDLFIKWALDINWDIFEPGH